MKMAAVVEVEVGGGAVAERELDEVRGIEGQEKERQLDGGRRGSEEYREPEALGEAGKIPRKEGADREADFP